MQERAWMRITYQAPIRQGARLWRAVRRVGTPRRRGLDLARRARSSFRFAVRSRWTLHPTRIEARSPTGGAARSRGPRGLETHRFPRTVLFKWGDVPGWASVVSTLGGGAESRERRRCRPGGARAGSNQALGLPDLGLTIVGRARRRSASVDRVELGLWRLELDDGLPALVRTRRG